MLNDPSGTSLNLKAPRLSDMTVAMAMLCFIKRTSRSFNRLFVPLSNLEEGQSVEVLALSSENADVPGEKLIPVQAKPSPGD
jgi:hypothetical protein